MRCFLGLDLEPKSKLAVEQWRDKSLPPFPHPVPAANFHITSVFLGNINNGQMDELCREIESCSFDPVTLTLNKLGFWSKPKILWLGSESTSQPALAMADTLTGIAKRCGIQIQERKYVPHVTLVRKVGQNAPAPLFVPDITCHFDTLHLFESVSSHHGVHYASRAQWPLFHFRSPGRQG